MNRGISLEFEYRLLPMFICIFSALDWFDYELRDLNRPLIGRFITWRHQSIINQLINRRSRYHTIVDYRFVEASLSDRERQVITVTVAARINKKIYTLGENLFSFQQAVFILQITHSNSIQGFFQRLQSLFYSSLPLLNINDDVKRVILRLKIAHKTRVIYNDAESRWTLMLMVNNKTLLLSTT